MNLRCHQKLELGQSGLRTVASQIIDPEHETVGCEGDSWSNMISGRRILLAISWSECFTFPGRCWSLKRRTSKNVGVSGYTIKELIKVHRSDIVIGVIIFQDLLQVLLWAESASCLSSFQSLLAGGRSQPLFVFKQLHCSSSSSSQMVCDGDIAGPCIWSFTKWALMECLSGLVAGMTGSSYVMKAFVAYRVESAFQGSFLFHWEDATELALAEAADAISYYVIQELLVVLDSFQFFLLAFILEG